jgi:hypothetical protein
MFDSLCVDSHLTTFKFELEISQNGTYFRNADEEIFLQSFLPKLINPKSGLSNL